MSGARTDAIQKPEELSCDYLVIGAGTSNLSFVDTLVDELPDATFIIADRFSRPGGHWTTAYPFVRLHQPSCNYGVNSRRLGKTKRGADEAFDLDDRATGEEICNYYAGVVDRFRETNRVEVYFNTNYVWNEEAQTHEIVVSSTTDGDSEVVYRVKCSKTVTCESRVIVPSMRDAPFPVDDSVSRHVVPVNALPEKVGNKAYNKYVVIGAGKTGTDAVTYLLGDGGVDPSDIAWIVSRDIWYFLRDGVVSERVPGAAYHSDVGRAMCAILLDPMETTDETYLKFERHGIYGRLDPDAPAAPEVFHGAQIDTADLETLRRVENVVRLGRVTSISPDEVVLEGGTLPFVPDGKTLFVDCTADKGLYGYYRFDEDFEFFGEDRIRLGPLVMVFNPSLTSSLVAFLEARFGDDSVKNSFLCFVRGEEKNHRLDSREQFLLGLYYQLKTIDRLAKHYLPAAVFLLTSRTNADAPMHHGGFLPFLWNAFGPLQMKKKTDSIMKNFEDGRYGFDVSMPGRKDTLDPGAVKRAQRRITKKGLFCS